MTSGKGPVLVVLAQGESSCERRAAETAIENVLALWPQESEGRVCGSYSWKKARRSFQKGESLKMEAPGMCVTHTYKIIKAMVHMVYKLIDTKRCQKGSEKYRGVWG